MRWTLLVAILSCLISPLSADAVFALLPSDGNVSGPPGSLVGWGYSLTNTDPSNWFVTTNLNSDSFSEGTPALLFDFPILAPGDTVTEPFDGVNNIGLYELQWDMEAPVGFINNGNFVLSGEWWDGDPLNGGNFIATAPDISSAYTATVSGPLGSAPEPPSFWLLVIGISLAASYRLQRGPEKVKVPAQEFDVFRSGVRPEKSQFHRDSPT